MWPKSAPRGIIESVGILTLLCLVFFGLRIIMTGTFRYWFIPGNLLLAWIALLSSMVLINQLKVRRWLSWQNLTLSALWLFFLPNTWYVLTDFIHVFPNGEVSQIYDIVLMATLVFCGFSLGLISLYLVHKEFIKRLGSRHSFILVELIILLSSFAIYLGRILRWNSWDAIINPSGLILNVTDRIIDPFGYPRALNMTALFFVLLSTVYFAFYRAHRAVPSKTAR